MSSLRRSSGPGGARLCPVSSRAGLPLPRGLGDARCAVRGAGLGGALPGVRVRGFGSWGVGPGVWVLGCGSGGCGSGGAGPPAELGAVPARPVPALGRAGGAATSAGRGASDRGPARCASVGPFVSFLPVRCKCQPLPLLKGHARASFRPPPHQLPRRRDLVRSELEKR